MSSKEPECEYYMPDYGICAPPCNGDCVKKRFKVYEKDADFVVDTKSGAMWSINVSSGRLDQKIRIPEPDYIAKLLVDGLNAHWKTV